KLLWAIGFTLVFMIAEFLGGYLSGSLAIMTDAAHLLSDCISFLIAVISIWISNKPPDGKMSFGYRRVEVIGAILSIVGIWALTAALVIMSIQRLISEDFEIDADTMIIVAVLGVVMNIATAFILHGSCSIVPHMHHGHSHGGHSHGHSHSHAHSNTNSQANLVEASSTPRSTPLSRSRSGSPTKKPCPKLDKLKICDEKNNVSNDTSLHEEPCSGGDHQLEDENLNVRAAIIHVIGDFIQSIGVLLAAIVIKFAPNLKVFDPICTFLFSIIVLVTTVRIFRDSMRILMDAVPVNISIEKLRTELGCIHGVKSVHELNVWSISTGLNLMTVHLTVGEYCW
ncbi:AAEL008693-PA, partial [Aedes aegypti]